MYYTPLAIIFGFAILSFSTFIPTIYFGILTGFAMLVALVGGLSVATGTYADSETANCSG
jgi:predicted RND superfamily exporter protein